MSELYQIQRTELNSRGDLANYRYDLVNTYTGGNVMSMYTTNPKPSTKLLARQKQLNQIWGMTGKKVKPLQLPAPTTNEWDMMKLFGFDPFRGAY